MKKLYQFRYYGEGHENNFPENLSLNSTVNLLQDYPTTTQLGIQAWPGAQFKLNNSSALIEIGMTSIYELELDGLTYLNELYFDSDTLAAAAAGHGIIIDIIYEI